ncbi:alpha/beta hydrolase-fold protein [Hyphomicrobium sp.]|uniref:alpha/beta hydrolase n=1 Tax=Hyphomicrobium sp. TaxID=82 RepID=UPI0025C10715|nr:alpha/beta hydrolase-fold protein [Hyphomicrobium sp.]
MRSRSGAEFRVFISMPLHPAPETGYPVIYVLDANAVFGTMTEAVRLQSARPQATGVGPAVVVGVGYPTDLPLDLERRTFDYTPEVDRAALSVRPDGSEWPPTGGAGVFLSFIEDELKPMIAAEYPIDVRRQVLFGHSFGGLFALYALFRRPRAFQTYIAGSPSIWFGARAILEAERGFEDILGDGPHDISLMIAVGALEQSLSPQERLMPGGAQRAAWIDENRMVDNARELVDRLQRHAARGLRVAYEEFPGENHVSVIPTLISRALRFALAPAQ